MYLGCPLSDVDAMAYRDSQLVAKGIYDRQHRELKINAKLHGAKLR